MNMIKNARVLTGKVISSNMNKTITVRIENTVKHPVYGKFVKRSRTVLAHDESNISLEGDTVAVRETRPISKRKVWVLESIVNKAR